MKKIILIGNSPLPEENTSSRPAAGLRTHQFLTVLKEQNNTQLLVVTVAMPECYRGLVIQEGKLAEGRNYKHYQFSKDNPFLVREIQKLHDEHEPDVIIGINSYPSFIACSINSKAIVWADLNGWILAEGQAQAAANNHNDYIPHYLQMERTIIGRADYFSTVSEAQKYAIIGELGISGRLNKDNFAKDMVISIPNATAEFSGDAVIKPYGGIDEVIKKIPTSAFKILWLGGYNTWMDEDTLLKGVENAMNKKDDIYFISTGGGLSGLSNVRFERFKEMADKSKHKDRFVFLGWVESKNIPYIYRCCDAGLNVDRLCVETETGARNRINEMMKFGLPVITSFGSEVAKVSVNAGAALGFKSGNVNDFAEKILKAYEMKKNGELGDMADGGKKFTDENNYLKVMKPFLDMLADASRSAGSVISGNRSVNFMRSGLRYLEENGFKKTLKKFYSLLK